MLSNEPWPTGRYRLRQKSYIGRVPGAQHEPLDEGEEVTWDGRPGPHMIPLDDAARAAFERAEREDSLGNLDPTSQLDLTTSGDQMVDMLKDRVNSLAAQLAEANATIARMTGAVAAPASALASAPVAQPAPVEAPPPPPPPPLAPAAPPPPPPRG